MAKDKEIKKKTFDYIAEFSSDTKYKEENFYNCGDAFLNACGVPGPIMGGINMFLGHTNSSKTTAMILAAVDAQKKGHLPIFIITEKKWDWIHAKQLGLQVSQDETGKWVGDFIFNDSFDYIEQITDFINKILDYQIAGKIDRSIVFLWDSVGSIPCKMTFDGKGGKQHNASVLADKIGMGISSRISNSKKEDYPTKENPLYATLVIVNQPWVDIPLTKFEGLPEIKAKGGNAIWHACTLVFLFGKQKKAGINPIDATKNGKKIVYAIRTRVSVIKNHMNGLQLKGGKIIVVPQGYIFDTKDAMEEYKKEYSKFWDDILGAGGELIITDTHKEEDEDDDDD
jgi:hypothetical protein